MFNLFKMEIYRGFKSKVIWVTLLLMAIISSFSVISSTMGSENNEAVNICGIFTTTLATPILLIIWAISISVYISGEYKNGFVKSIAGQIANRSYLAISKLLFFITYTIGMFAISFIFVLVASLIAGGNNVTFGFSSQMIVLWITQFILYVGFSCIFILLSIVTKSSALGIGLGIFMGCGLTTLIYTGISKLVDKIGIANGFDFGSYMVETNVQYMQMGISKEYIIRAIIIGLAFSVIMIFASGKVLNKRDV